LRIGRGGTPEETKAERGDEECFPKHHF